MDTEELVLPRVSQLTVPGPTIIEKHPIFESIPEVLD